jgi:protein TonB
MQTTVESKDRIKALVGASLFYLLLFIVFYFVVFKSPIQEIGGGDGIVLNYGIDAEGSGDLQTTASANDSKNPEDSKPAPQQEREITPTPTRAETTPVTSAAQDKVVTTDDEGPVSIPPKDAPKTVVSPREVAKAEPTPVAEKPKALYPGKSANTSGANGKNGTSNSPTGNNNGDRPGKVGDQGDPNGSMDSRALYGTPGKGTGGSGGGGLNLPGWRYDVAPQPDPFDNESGMIRFQIKIDGNGDLVSVKVMESTVSPQVANWYKNQVQKTTFSRTTAGNTSSGATGTITFIIRSN